MNDLKQLISDTETDFSELKDPVAFLDNVRKRKILFEEARHKQEEFNRCIKYKNWKKNLKNKKKTLVELISFLIKETMLRLL